MRIPDICPICGKSLSINTYVMVAFEVPYCNLFVHKETCEDILLSKIDNNEIDEILLKKLCKGDIILEDV